MKVPNKDGVLVTAAGGLVFPASKSPLGFEVVQIRPPLFIPDAALPCTNPKYRDVASALGVPILWPEEYIDVELTVEEQASSS